MDIEKLRARTNKVCEKQSRKGRWRYWLVRFSVWNAARRGYFNFFFDCRSVGREAANEIASRLNKDGFDIQNTYNGYEIRWYK